MGRTLSQCQTQLVPTGLRCCAWQSARTALLAREWPAHSHNLCVTAVFWARLGRAAQGLDDKQSHPPFSMAIRMQPVRFEPHQRVELLRLGLVNEAIDQIEVDALPRAQFIIKPDPPLGSVRDELSDVAQAIGGAQSAIEKLLSATEAAPHRLAALQLVAAVALPDRRRHIFGGARLQDAFKSLAKAMEVVEDAMAEIPPGPIRHRTASDLPIDLIHSALQLGFIFAGREPLHPTLRPSASPTSAFRRIIGICYEAIGAGSNDPERAIKAFVKRWRSDQELRTPKRERGTERP